MELFRGYVPTRNKQCLEKFKGVEKLKTRSEVQDLDEYAGILGEETILIDVDDAETSELLFRMVQDLELKCRVYATTRGKHFLFKNCGVKKSWTKCTLAVGITTDGKVGANNSYEILKSGGVERPILYDFPEGEIQELPKWLTPFKKTSFFRDKTFLFDKFATYLKNNNHTTPPIQGPWKCFWNWNSFPRSFGNRPVGKAIFPRCFRPTVMKSFQPI